MFAIFSQLKVNLDRPEDPTGQIVRGEIIIGGWHFEKITENRTKAINFVINDYKGNIPQFLLNMGKNTMYTIKPLFKVKENFGYHLGLCNIELEFIFSY